MLGSTLQRGQRGIQQPRRQPGSLTRLKPQLLAHRMRDDQNVGKQDRTVEAEPPDRLHCHFGGRLGIIAKLEKTALFRTQFPIFRQIAARLTHQPDRRLLGLPAEQCLEQNFRGIGLVRHRAMVIHYNI